MKTLMAIKSAALVPLAPDVNPLELEAATNRARAMKEILEDLDKGDLHKFLDEYSRKIEHYAAGTKARTAKKK